MPIRVFVVDDSDVYLDAVREVVDACPGFVLVGSAPTGEAALARAPETNPDLVLIDSRLPGMDGPATCCALTGLGLDARYVLCSVGDDPRKPADATCAAAAFLSKADISPRTLRDAWESRSPASTADAGG